MSIGVDIVEVGRLRALIERPHFVARTFSPAEQSYCMARSDPALHFAGTFAAKEAVIKALRLGNLPAWARRIEILRNDGIPRAVVHRADGDVEVEVSIAHERGFAVAAALG